MPEFEYKSYKLPRELNDWYPQHHNRSLQCCSISQLSHYIRMASYHHDPQLTPDEFAEVAREVLRIRLVQKYGRYEFWEPRILQIFETFPENMPHFIPMRNSPRPGAQPYKPTIPKVCYEFRDPEPERIIQPTLFG